MVSIFPDFLEFWPKEWKIEFRLAHKRLGNTHMYLNIIGTSVSTLFILTAFILLLVGCNCYFNHVWITNAQTCENVYISGIITAFFVGVFAAFAGFIYMVDQCDRSTTTAPVVKTKNPSIHESISYNKKKTKKKSPLSTVVVSR